MSVLTQVFLFETTDKHVVPVLGGNWSVPFWSDECFNRLGQLVKGFPFSEDVLFGERARLGDCWAYFDEVLPVVSRISDGCPGFPGDRSDLGFILRGVDIFGNVASTRMFGRGRTGSRRVASGVGTGLCHGHRRSEGS